MIDYATLADAGYAYKTGVTYNEGIGTVLTTCPAFITSSQSRVWAAITLPKPVFGASSISITKLVGSMRTISGNYISGGSRDWANVISSASLAGINTVQLQINVSGLSNLPTNNTPVTFSIEGDFTFSFS